MRPYSDPHTDSAGHQHDVPPDELELHQLEGLACPCEPEYGPPCEECAESTGGADGCPVCQGDGMLERQPDDPGPFLVIHSLLRPMVLAPYEP